jgi:hypothetical protein
MTLSYFVNVLMYTLIELYAVNYELEILAALDC